MVACIKIKNEWHPENGKRKYFHGKIFDDRFLIYAVGQFINKGEYQIIKKR